MLITDLCIIKPTATYNNIVIFGVDGLITVVNTVDLNKRKKIHKVVDKLSREMLKDKVK